ncbi:trypsin-like peptidase domain-containing protein [Actinoplanes solisilvae]|uniref:trypsin-like peptidase domain-containing protein n=1 Tax=Actinoplanes solisilvae TaxID=2486853 RepID=UPI000FDB83E7|nr:trypsin-like peptidase domain-containing protein [Actinoplanes solisilvae]
MNENETDPRPADASTESSSPDRGQSEQPTAAQPAVPPPAAPAAPQWGRPAPEAPHPAAAQPGVVPPSGVPSAAPQSAIPQSGVPQSGIPQSGAPQWQQPSPWQHAGYQQPQHPGYGQQAQPGYPQQPTYQPGYASAWAPGTPPAQPLGGTTPTQPLGGTTQTQPLAGAEGQAWGEGQAWSPGAGGQPGWAPGSDGQPVWAQSVDQQPRGNGRGRKIFLAGAAAVLIALGAGGVGAATALAFDDGGRSPSVQTGNSSVSRVVDRSSLAQIAAAVQDSVVSITTGSGEGSGVVISADGYIVTNNHVVSTAQGSNVTVIFADGNKADAKIVGTDPRTDLAVVKTSGLSNLKAATFGSSAKVQVGDTVLAIGSPLGLEGSVTAGIISAKDRTIQSGGEDNQQSPFGGQQQQQQGSTTSMSGLLQTDAPINPGNSGGALVNVNSEVIGINSAIATQGGSSGNIGLGFAIPSDKARQVADDLMAGKKVSHPALGVGVAEAENGGALVSQVTPSSAAAKAGLQQGDVITSADGKNINDANDLIAAVQSGAVGQKMTIEFTRGGEKKQVTVTLAEAQ